MLDEDKHGMVRLYDRQVLETDGAVDGHLIHADRNLVTAGNDLPFFRNALNPERFPRLAIWLSSFRRRLRQAFRGKWYKLDDTFITAIEELFHPSTFSSWITESRSHSPGRRRTQ